MVLPRLSEVSVDEKQKPKPEHRIWSESDRAALELLAKERNHRTWLWAMVRRWAQWIVASILGVTVIIDALLKVWKYFTGHTP